MANKRVAIIDDESDSREILRTYLKQEYSNLTIIGEADSIQSGI